MSNTGRIQWIDSCKGLAIILVVLGHTMRTDLSLVYIYGFHMPLFFFLSGVVCDEKKYTWISFLKSRFNSIIIPYIVFYLLTWLYWICVERGVRPLGMEWWEPLVGMVYGAQWHQYMSVNGILWFLPCLFTTEVLFYAVKKLNNVRTQWVVVFILACAGLLFKTNLPWCVNISFVALQFFFIGNFLRNRLLDDSEDSKKKSLLMYIGAIAISIYAAFAIISKNKVNMATNDYGSAPVFEIMALCGVVGVVAVCKALSLSKIRNTWGGYLGQNTMVVFALHQPILRILRYVGEKFFIEFPVETNVLYALFADSIAFLILIPLIFFYNKYGLKLLRNLYL